jgi:hypothetical protein
MALDTRQIGKDMVAAAAGVVNEKWPDIKEYADSEMKAFAKTLGRISARHAAGKLSQVNARAMVRAQVKSMEIVLLAVEGMGILMVESMINAAIAAIRTSVNKAIGFALL